MYGLMVQADYATVEAVKLHLAESFTETTSDAFLKSLIREASDVFARSCNRVFVPYPATLTLVPVRTSIELSIPDLLSLTSIAVDDGETALTATDYRIEPTVGYPKTHLRRKLAYWLYDDEIEIVGTFGCHPDPDRMWLAKTTLGAAIVSTTATTLTLTSTTGIETLDYIQVDSEVMQVTSVTNATTLVVTRGELRTTAATHLISATVSLYRQDEPVRRAVVLSAAHLYQTRANPGGERISGPQGNYVVSPQEADIVARTVALLARREPILV